MKMGRQPSSPTRATAYTHASLFILVNMSLASFSSFSEGFLGGMGQNALRVALPETRIIFSVYFPESRTYPFSPTPRSRPHPLLPVPPSPPPCLLGPPKSPPQAPAADGSASPARLGSPEKRGGGDEGWNILPFSQRILKAGSGARPGGGSLLESGVPIVEWERNQELQKEGPE